MDTKMKVIGISGSPRKDWNTDLLVQQALKGAESKGAETELYHLYDLRFRGCVSCFRCKKKESSSLGRCIYADELLPILNRIHRCDGLVLGSPIYIGEVSSGMRAFIERLAFQYITYEKDKISYFDRRLPVLSIYTMNAPEEAIKASGYDAHFLFYENCFNRFLGGPATTLTVTETLQTDDYGAYHMSKFDEEARKKRREDVFPGDLQRAFDMGATLINRGN